MAVCPEMETSEFMAAILTSKQPGRSAKLGHMHFVRSDSASRGDGTRYLYLDRTDGGPWSANGCPAIGPGEVGITAPGAPGWPGGGSRTSKCKSHCACTGTYLMLAHATSLGLLILLRRREEDLCEEMEILIKRMQMQMVSTSS